MDESLSGRIVQVRNSAECMQHCVPCWRQKHFSHNVERDGHRILVNAE